MLRLPMHPRYSRMLVEASRRGCVPAAAQCAALVSGRDLLMRLGRDDGHVKEARELFEGSALTDFHTLMRAQQFAKNARFDVNQCRRHGVHAQSARQVEDTFRQILQIAERERLVKTNRRRTQRAPTGLRTPTRTPWQSACSPGSSTSSPCGATPARSIVS